VVEDEEGIRTLARLVLEHAGVEALVAASSEEALRIADAHPGSIQLLVADVNVPELPGPALAERLKVRRLALGVLYTAGHLAGDAVRRQVHHGRVHFLQKPFGLMTLAQRVRHLLGGE